MGLFGHFKRNTDIRKNEPIHSADEARERISTRTRRSKYLSAGLMTLALGFGVMGSRSASTQSTNTEAGVEIENEVPKREPFSSLATIGLIGTLGASYTERRFLRRSLNQTVERFRIGQGIPSGGNTELKLIETADGRFSFESIPTFVGTKTPEPDAISSLPSLGAWTSASMLDQAMFDSSLDRSVQLGFGATGAVFLAGTLAMEMIAHKNISLIGGDALQRIDQLDPNLVKE